MSMVSIAVQMAIILQISRPFIHTILLWKSDAEKPDWQVGGRIAPLHPVEKGQASRYFWLAGSL